MDNHIDTYGLIRNGCLLNNKLSLKVSNVYLRDPINLYLFKN